MLANNNDQAKQQEIQLLPHKNWEWNPKNCSQSTDTEAQICTKKSKTRPKWGKEIEFLFSCISLSVGLGNVWRFPFIALENGGGAFVIPYVIVLLLIGRPVYYLEVVIGQFSSRGAIKGFSFAPIMKGVAYGQIYATGLATTYYACIMGLTIKFLFVSFSTVLPWGYCREEWGPQCLNASGEDVISSNTSSTSSKSSAEFYFINEILREVDTLEDGLGDLNWDLLGCLALTWCIIGMILIKGIRSSGKAAYFIAIFPYIVMLILFIRAITLPGSLDGITYFLKPQWEQLLNPKVWYNAITQVFFSLAICFGTLIMYASYNNFNRNMYKDIIIINFTDAMTSILAGCIIFGILGNLAYETKASSIATVVKGGTGLAFISYPDAIAKFKFIPQMFAVLFFLMLLVLGIGSNIGMASCVITVIKDQFTGIPNWALAVFISFIGFILGTVYMTPGGQFILNLVDFFGASFIALVLAIGELIAVGWIYGIKRFCSDIEFMLNVKTGIYWRICWGIITPGMMFLVLVYTLVQYQPLTYKNVQYPEFAYGKSRRIQIIGWTMSAIGILQLPGWALYCIYKQPKKTFYEKFLSACQPESNWGPTDPKIFEQYTKFQMERENSSVKPISIWGRFVDNLLS